MRRIVLFILSIIVIAACKNQPTMNSQIGGPTETGDNTNSVVVNPTLSIEIKDSSNSSDWFNPEYNLNQFAGYKYESKKSYSDAERGDYVITAEVIAGTYPYIKFVGYSGFTGNEALMDSGLGAAAHGANYTRMFNKYSGYLPSSASAVFTTNGLIVNFGGYKNAIEFILISTNKE